MAVNFTRKDYAVTTVVAPSYTGGLQLILNKFNVEVGDELLFVFVMKNCVIRMYDRTKELVKDAIVTDYNPASGGWENPTYDRDYDDSSYTRYRVGAAVTDADLRIYDLGSVGERYLRFSFAANAETALKLYSSIDGATWELVAGPPSGSGIVRKTFRYLKFVLTASPTVVRYVYINYVEAFNVADPLVQLTQEFGDYIFVHANSGKMVFIEGERIGYAVYRFRKIEQTLRRGVIEI